MRIEQAIDEKKWKDTQSNDLKGTLCEVRLTGGDNKTHSYPCIFIGIRTGVMPNGYKTLIDLVEVKTGQIVVADPSNVFFDHTYNKTFGKIIEPLVQAIKDERFEMKKMKHKAKKA